MTQESRHFQPVGTRVPREMPDRKDGMYSSIRESDMSPENWQALSKFCSESGLPITAFYYDRKNSIIYNEAMSLEGNTSVTAFPENLTINGYLNISGCVNLKGLPETIHIRGQIIIKDRKGIQDKVIKDAARLIKAGRIQDGLGGITFEAEEWKHAWEEIK